MPREPLATTCPMDCPDTCSLAVEVDADGRVPKIRGSHDNPDTGGFICAKVGRYGDRLEAPERLLRPLRRSGPKGSGRFEPVSWDEAVAEIRRELERVRDRWGGEAILPYHYGGSNGLLSEGLADRELFRRLGASRLEKTICAAPTGAVQREMYGKMPGVAHGDYPAARAVVVWGANPKVSQIHLVPRLHEARKNGAFVAVVDPLKNFSDNEIDLHLPVLPGTDLVVALAMIHRAEERGRIDRAFLERHARGGAGGARTLLERAAEWPPERAAREAGVPVDDLLRLADAYAEASPAVVRLGWGVERNRNGGQASAAILALPALLGKLGVRGGGYTMSNSRAARLDLDAVLGASMADPIQGSDGPGSSGSGSNGPRSINMTRLGALLTEGPGALGLDGPPVRALVVYNSNPAATTPDQNRVLEGLADEELFTVVVDQVHTDTAAWADLVLPATTFLEQWDLRTSYGSYVIGGIRPVVERRGEARPNHEIFAALGRAFGFDDPVFSWGEREAFDRVADALTAAGDPVDRERLAAGLPVTFDFPGPSPVQLDSVQPGTPDGRIDLCPPCLGDEPYRYLPVDGSHENRPTGEASVVGPPRFPLALVSPGSRHRISSTMGELDNPPLELTLHPDDAERRGLASGDRVRVWNERGAVVCPLRVSGRARPGVALLPKGTWRRASLNGQAATALCPDHVDRTAGGACFNDARVEVERAAGTGGAGGSDDGESDGENDGDNDGDND